MVVERRTAEVIDFAIKDRVKTSLNFVVSGSSESQLIRPY